MLAVHLQRAGDQTGGDEPALQVLRGGLGLGWIKRDRFTKAYRYFPGMDNDVAFVFEHADLAIVLRMVETRDWAAELQTGTVA